MISKATEFGLERARERFLVKTAVVVGVIWSLVQSYLTFHMDWKWEHVKGTASDGHGKAQCGRMVKGTEDWSAKNTEPEESAIIMTDLLSLVSNRPEARLVMSLIRACRFTNAVVNPQTLGNL